LGERRVVFAVPGDPATASGGYGYDRRVASELRDAGWDVRWLRLPDTFPLPDAQAIEQAHALLAAQPAGVPLLIDGLALGALPEVGAAAGDARPLVALVHHPLALESGLDARQAAGLRDTERRALAAARRIITTSRSTAALLREDYAVPETRIVVAPPGTDPAPPSRGGGREEMQLLAVGMLVPRKGHDVLIDALARLRHLRWRLTIVGDDTRDPATAQALRARIAAAGLEGRITLTGAVDPARLEAMWAGADLFVLASRHEGFGMAYAEAVARGLPVIGTTAGAIAEAVPPGAGILVRADDVDALCGALEVLIGDGATRARCAAAARVAAAMQPRWPDTAARVADALADAR
jgi:glycosyltransferase involved in cell wall biosynthesis